MYLLHNMNRSSMHGCPHKCTHTHTHTQMHTRTPTHTHTHKKRKREREREREREKERNSCFFCFVTHQLLTEFAFVSSSYAEAVGHSGQYRPAGSDRALWWHRPASHYSIFKSKNHAHTPSHSQGLYVSLTHKNKTNTTQHTHTKQNNIQLLF